MRPRVRRHLLLPLATIAIVAAGAAAASAQTISSTPRTVEERLTLFRTAVDALVARGLSLEAALMAVADVKGSQVPALIYYAVPPESMRDTYLAFLGQLQKARVDEPISGGPAAGSGANVSPRSGLASLLTVALESGAVTGTFDDNVATLRGNADGMWRFLTNQPVFAECPVGPSACRSGDWLRNVEVSASFNASQGATSELKGTVPGSSNTVQFANTTNGKTFTGMAARYAIRNPRDLRSAQSQARWQTWRDANASALAQAGTTLLSDLSPLLGALTSVGNQPTVAGDASSLTVYAQWLGETRKALQAVAPSGGPAWQTVFAGRLDDLLGRLRAANANVDAALASAGSAFVRHASTLRTLESSMITDNMLTLEAAYAKPAAAPPSFSVNAYWAWSPKATPQLPLPGTLTLTGGVSFYTQSQPTGAGTNGRWRHVQMAAQFDRPLGRAGAPATLSIGGYFQYSGDNTPVIVVPAGATQLPGTTIPLPAAGTKLLGERGSIGVAQVLVTFRVGPSGVKIPLGISWANRRDLITGNGIRGHIGLTFDPSSLLLLVPGGR